MEQERKVDLSEFDALSDEDIRAAIAQDPDAAPEVDETTFAAFRPAEEVLPRLVAAYRASALHSGE